MPFMVGSSVVAHDDGLVIIGGGATCFSMGTYWETGVYSITGRDGLWRTSSVWPTSRELAGVKFLESRKTVRCASGDGRSGTQPVAKAAMTAVPRVCLGPQKTFEEILGDGKPVIIEGLALGDCLRNWTSDYLIQQVGGSTEVRLTRSDHGARSELTSGRTGQVVVHECHRDTERMDFNSKNFGYVRDSFKAVMAKMQAGRRLYLRSLSHEKPSEQAANIKDDFPKLAEDFILPPELAFVSRNLFSSVLRVSGKVNMWLHYDVRVSSPARQGPSNRGSRRSWPMSTRKSWVANV